MGSKAGKHPGGGPLVDTLLPIAVQGGPWVLLALLVVRGWLIPRWTHLQITKYMQRTIDAQEATIAERDKQIAILLGRKQDPPT